jgi:cytochrome c-type biogenesis protein CcmE
MMQATGLGQLEAENVLLNGNENYSPNEVAIMIRELDQNGWKDTADGEIESFYKSMGIRVGLRAKF